MSVTNALNRLGETVDPKESLLFAFSRLKDKKFLVYILVQYGLTVGFVAAFLAYLFFAGAGVLAAAAASGVLNPQNPAQALAALASPAFLSSLALAVLGFAALLVVFELAMGLVRAYIELHALSVRGLAPAPFSLARFARLVLLVLYRFFFSFFYAYAPRLRYALWACLVGALAGAALVVVSMATVRSVESFLANLWLAGAGVALFVLSVAAWLVLATYNGMRLWFAPLAFLHRGLGVRAAMRRSWEVTRGNLIDALLPLLGLGLVKVVLGFLVLVAVGLPLSMLAATALAGMAGGDEALARQAMNAFEGVVNLGSNISDLLLTPVYVVLDALVFVAVYDYLLRAWRRRAPAPPSAAVAAPAP